jgi:hypothetical protein
VPYNHHYTSFTQLLVTSYVRFVVKPHCLQAAAAKLERIRRQGIVNWACACIRAAPFIRGLLAKEKAKIAAKIAAGIQRDGLAMTHLPKQGRPAKAVLELLKGESSRLVNLVACLLFEV